MTPLRVKAYLIKQRRTTIASLSQHFEIEKPLAKVLIDFWVMRQSCVPVDLCGDCHLGCSLVYQWVGDHA